MEQYIQTDKQFDGLDAKVKIDEDLGYVTKLPDRPPWVFMWTEFVIYQIIFAPRLSSRKYLLSCACNCSIGQLLYCIALHRIFTNQFFSKLAKIYGLVREKATLVVHLINRQKKSENPQFKKKLSIKNWKINFLKLNKASEIIEWHVKIGQFACILFLFPNQVQQNTNGIHSANTHKNQV
jgi:hypothetical protein